jgi:hypothetical protein
VSLSPEAYLQVKEIAQSAADAAAMVAIRYTRAAMKLEKLGGDWVTIDQAASVLETTPELIKRAMKEGFFTVAKGGREVSADSVLLMAIRGGVK